MATNDSKQAEAQGCFVLDASSRRAALVIERKYLADI
jgi:hypothetical protein